MEKVYILVVTISDGGTITTETSLFFDLVSAKVRFGEELHYQEKKAPQAGLYDGYNGHNFWFDLGETNEEYWCRCEIQEKSINC